VSVPERQRVHLRRNTPSRQAFRHAGGSVTRYSQKLFEDKIPLIKSDFNFFETKR
jgi:hypothetical protein